MDISIIVPTYNRKFFLENCLKSLFNQTYPQDKYEIIIIDDGSNDGTGELIKKLSKNHHLRYFYQENKGWSSGRNLGIKKAKGEIIVFIDSDCIAFPEWLRIVALSFKKAAKEVGGIGGPTVTKIYKQNIVARVDQAILNYFINKFKKGKDVLFLPTCNLSFKKEIFAKIGNFDTDFDKEAGEDSEFCWRIIKNGYKLIYKPEMQVEHLQRNTFGSFLLQNFTYGRGMYLVRKKHQNSFYIKSDILSVFKKSLDEIFIFPFKIAQFFPKWPEKITALFLSFLRQLVFFMGIISAKIKYQQD
jgi:glycosyltransferase involved in cell wall biosynthesis